MKHLVGAMYCAHFERPALIVGGGPSAPEQYAKVISALHNPIVISANAHAWKLGVDAHYIVCKDHRHTETKELMEDLLRPYGVPIFSRQYWADHRLVQWPVQGNSGQMALGVATLMGCAPIVPIGFDGYDKGTYFHDLHAKNVSQGIRPAHWDLRYKRMASKLELAPIRTLGGPVARAFPRFDPNERFDRLHMPVSLRIYEAMTEYQVRAKTRFPLKYDPSVEVPEGYQFPVDAIEAQQYGRNGCIEFVDSDPRPVVISRLQATAPRGNNLCPQG